MPKTRFNILIFVLQLGLVSLVCSTINIDMEFMFYTCTSYGWSPLFLVRGPPYKKKWQWFQDHRMIGSACHRNINDFFLPGIEREHFNEFSSQLSPRSSKNQWGMHNKVSNKSFTASVEMDWEFIQIVHVYRVGLHSLMIWEMEGNKEWEWKQCHLQVYSLWHNELICI